MTDFQIGFDAKRAFCNFTGLGNYSRSLIAGLGSNYPGQKIVLFTPRAERRPETEFLFRGSYQIVTGNRPLWRSVFIRNEIRLRGISLYHGLSHELPLFSKPGHTKYVVTICDLIYSFFPNDFTFIDRNIYHVKTKSACAKADRIIAISESTKNDIVRLYNTDPDKIDVVYPSCHDRFIMALPNDSRLSTLKKHGLPALYLLYVGSIIERKNLLTLVQALHALPEKTTPPLVVIGKGGKYKERVLRYISSNHLEKRVLFIPHINPEDQPAVYQSAAFLIYPSVYEGFGLPIIEALYSKIPVITSPCSSLPEAAGPGALYADPHSPEDLAGKISTLLHDKPAREKLIAEGFKHVQKFNANTVAEALIKTYIKTIGHSFSDDSSDF